MKLFYNKASLLLIGHLVISHLFSCAGNAPKDGPCVRKCGSRPIAGGKIKASALATTGTLKCSDYDIRFLVVEDHTPPGAATSETETTSAAPASTSATKVEENTPKMYPVAGVAFVPQITGLATFSTPASDWCTDSCGIASLTVTPTCAAGTVNVGILVPTTNPDGGAANLAPNVAFTISP